MFRGLFYWFSPVRNGTRFLTRVWTHALVLALGLLVLLIVLVLLHVVPLPE
ncbi:MAG: hypothetical protein U0793_21755 [Gemmataceae bacterium]